MIRITSFKLKFGKTIDVRVLASCPLLLLDSGFVVRKTFDAVCRVAKLKPKIAMESRAPSNLLALAEAGHGVAVIPSVVLTHRYKLRVARITHEGRVVLPRYARDFCALLATHMRALVSRSPPVATLKR